MAIWNYILHVIATKQTLKIVETRYLLVKIKKAFRTVDIVKRSKTSDGAINVHWMSS